MKIKSTVYPDQPLPFNDWAKHIANLLFTYYKARHETNTNGRSA